MIELEVGERRFVRVKAVHRRSGAKVQVSKGGRGQPTPQPSAHTQVVAAGGGGPHAELHKLGATPPKQHQPEQASEVSWETSDANVVTVQGDGDGAWLQGVGQGKATVEASFTADLGNGETTERAAIAVSVSSEPQRSGAWIDG